MFKRKKIADLAAIKSESCVSFYIPTHRVDGIQEDQIRYKNTLQKVEQELTESGLNTPEIDRMLAEAYGKLGEENFWQHLSDTLAVFIYDGKTEFYPLPVELEQYIFVGTQLYLLPLLAMVGETDSFYLLALSQNEVKVYEGDQYTIAELEKNDAFPESLAQVLSTYDAQRTLQNHSGDTNSTIFHGHGGGKDVKNARLEEYLRQVNEGIAEMVCDGDQNLLIVFTTPNLIGQYRQINTYPHLVEEYIEGNPEDEGMDSLHAKAWNALLPHYVDRESANEEAFEAKLANEQASFNLITVGPAVFAGQVDRLYVAANREVWGTYDPEKHLIELHAERQTDSQPLLNDLALATYLQGGAVLLREQTDLMRPTSYVNASFRYALQSA